MNLLVIGIGIGHEKDLIIGYRYRFKFFISCIPTFVYNILTIGTRLSRCTQQGETRNTQTRRYFKIIVFNDNIRGRQGKVDTPGITSRPDKMEFNKQDLNTHRQITHTWNELTHNYKKRAQETNHIRKQEAGTQDTHKTPLT